MPVCPSMQLYYYLHFIFGELSSKRRITRNEVFMSQMDSLLSWF